MKKLFRLFVGARDRGLSLSGLWVLALLEEHGERPMGFLGDRLCVTSAAMTGIIDGLCRDGLVIRTALAGDRRVYVIRLTPEGVAFLAGKKVKVPA